MKKTSKYKKIMENNKIAIVITLVMSIAIFNILIYFFFSFRDTYLNEKKIYLAIVAPLKSKRGLNVMNAAYMYLNSINNKINNNKVELVYYNDYNDIKNAEETALKIVNGKKILLVLGHYYNLTSIAAGDIYKKNEIPAITGSATAEEVTLNSEWYFKTIPGTKAQASLIANYIANVLNINSVNIIFEDDYYGSSLRENFEKIAIRRGVIVWSTFKINSLKDDESELKKFIDKLRKGSFVFIAANASTGAKAVVALKNAEKNFTIYGVDEFASESFLDELKKYGDKSKKIEFYSDGIYCTSPYMNSIANYNGHNFEKEFLNLYGQKPTWEAASYYEAIHIAVEAIKKVDIKSLNNVIENRKKIRDALNSFYSPKNSIQGLVEDIYFNRQRSVMRPYAIVRYNGATIASSLVQYQTVSQENKDIYSLFEQILKGKCINIDGKLMKFSNIMYTWIDEIDFSNIDFNNFTYDLNFRLHLSFSKDYNFDETDIKFTNSVEDPILISDDNNKYDATNRLYTVKGKFKFKTDYNYSAFPFDQQIISVSLYNKNKTTDTVAYIPDELKIRTSSVDKIIKKDVKSNEWINKSCSIFEDFLSYGSSLGLMRYTLSKYKIDYSQFNVQINIKRQLKFIFNILLPIIIIFILLYFIFLYPNNIKFYIWIFLISFLGNAIYHYYLLSKFYSYYTMAVEYLIFIAYLFILLLLFTSKLMTKLHNQNNEVCLRKIILAGKFGYPILCLMIFITFILVYN